MIITLIGAKMARNDIVKNPSSSHEAIAIFPMPSVRKDNFFLNITKVPCKIPAMLPLAMIDIIHLRHHRSHI